MLIIKNSIRWKVDKVGKLNFKLLIINFLHSNMLAQSLPITINSLSLCQISKTVYQLETLDIVEVYTVCRVFTH